MSVNLILLEFMDTYQSRRRRNPPPPPPDFSVYAGIICVLGLSVYILVKEFWQW